MAETKTKPTKASVKEFIAKVENGTRRRDARPKRTPRVRVAVLLEGVHRAAVPDERSGHHWSDPGHPRYSSSNRVASSLNTPLSYVTIDVESRRTVSAGATPSWTATAR